MTSEEEPADDYIDENIVRIVLSLLVAAAVPATFMAVAVWVANDFRSSVIVWFITFVIALIHAFGLGFPGFLILQRLGWTQWWVSLIGGFLVGAIPYAIFFRTSPLHGPGLLGIPAGFAAWLVWSLGNHAKKNSSQQELSPTVSCGASSTKLADYILWIKKYNGWFIIIAIMAAIFFWLVMPPVWQTLISAGSTLPQWFRSFREHWQQIEECPVAYLATVGIYYFISLKFLNARAQKIVNIVFALYVAVQFLALALMWAGLLSDSIRGIFD